MLYVEELEELRTRLEDEAEKCDTVYGNIWRFWISAVWGGAFLF